MRFFLDENFPKMAAQLLSERGHETFDVRGTEMEGVGDTELFLLAQRSQAVFLTTDTTDRDFFHTVPHIYPGHAGVVVVALRQPNRGNILAKLSWLLDNVPTAQIGRRVFLLRDENYVAFPPLQS